MAPVMCFARPQLISNQVRQRLDIQENRLSRVGHALEEQVKAQDAVVAVYHRMRIELQDLHRRALSDAAAPSDALKFADESISSVLSLSSAFDKFDVDLSGGIDVHEIRAALHALGLNADSDQAGRILKAYDAYPDQLVDVKEFTAIVRDVRILLTFDRDGTGTLDSRELHPALVSLGLKTTADHADAILRYFDADCSGRLDLVEMSALVRSLQTFQRYDVDGSGAIDIDELRPALRKLGLATSSASNAAILQRYDSDQSGQIELAEFAVLVRDLSLFREFDVNGDGVLDAAELEPALKQLGLLSAVGSSLVAQILRAWDTDRNESFDLLEFAQLVSDIRVFRIADTDGDGSLDIHELGPALQRLGVDVSTLRAADAMARYDVDRSGGIDLEEFASLVHDLQDVAAPIPDPVGGGDPDDEEIRPRRRLFVEGSPM